MAGEQRHYDSLTSLVNDVFHKGTPIRLGVLAKSIVCSTVFSPPINHMPLGGGAVLHITKCFHIAEQKCGDDENATQKDAKRKVKEVFLLKLRSPGLASHGHC